MSRRGRARDALLTGGRNYQRLIADVVKPDLWFSMRATSGTNEENRGLLGSAVDGVISNMTLAQVGQLGTDEAYLFNGTTSLIAAPISNTMKAYKTQRWMFVIKATGLGESSAGQLFCWGNGSSEAKHFLRFRATNALEAIIYTNGTAAHAFSTNNEISSILNRNAVIFMDYDDNNVLGRGRKIRLFKDQSSKPVALALGTNDDAATGTVSTMVGDLNFGNRTDTTQTFAGLMDEALGQAGLWTDDLMTKIIRALGL